MENTHVEQREPGGQRDVDHAVVYTTSHSYCQLSTTQKECEGPISMKIEVRHRFDILMHRTALAACINSDAEL